MKRPVMIHALLLLAALVAAYLTWTRDRTTSGSAGTEDDVQILSLRGNLDRVIYTSEDRTVEIDRRKDDRGAYHWVRVDTMELPPTPPPKLMHAPAPAKPPEATAEPKKAEATAEPKKAAFKKAVESLSRDPKADPDKKPAKAPSKAEPTKVEPNAALKPAVKLEPKVLPKPEPTKPVAKVHKVQQFKGNKSVEELMKGLANLSAVRSLGHVDTEKLKAFGLEGTKKSLTLISGSSPRIFFIGGNTFGNQDVYLQSKEDGRVYVVRPRLLQDFTYAEFRLMDRSLQSFENNEVEKAVITAEGKKRTLVQQNRRDPANSYWADEPAPQQRKDLFKNWMTKVLGLRLLEYVAPDKKIEPLKLVLTVEYLSAGSPIGALRLYRREGPVAKVPGSTDETGDYYAQTENTRSLVKIGKPSGDEVVRDITNVLRE